MDYLLEKFEQHYNFEDRSFIFKYDELNFDLLFEFEGWQHTALLEGQEQLVLFYRD